MEQGLQKVNHQSRLMEWGQQVSEWCAGEGIPVSTYYSWQRKVFKAVSAGKEICFARVPVRAAGSDISASIECGGLRVEIRAGADAETIQAIIQALKLC